MVRVRDFVIDEELRTVFIAQIIRGKEQLYQSMSLPHSSNDNLDGYQWSESEDDGCPKCLSEGLKIESDEEDSCDECTDIATVMYNTGLIHMKHGEFDSAEKCFNLAVECFDVMSEESECNDGNNFAYKSLVFADLFNNIGYIQYRNGNIIEAENNFTKALQIGKSVVSQACGDYKNKIIQGYKHIGTIYYNIGVMKAMLGFNDEVISPLECSLGLQKVALGGKSPNIGVMKAMLGLKDEVIRPLECSLGLQKVALGDSHPDIAIVQHNIGIVLIGAEQWDDAMSAFLESLRIIRFVYGNEDRKVAKELFNIAKVHEMKGEYEEAIHVYEESLRIERLTLGMLHPETIMTMYEIGQIYHRKGDLNEALNAYSVVLSVAKAASDIEESSIIFILGEMVAIYLEIGNIDAARKLYAEVSDTIELDSCNEEIVDIVGLAQVRDLLANIPAAAAA
eukprot:CAMPEP_0172518808 /NCGR_PEP_ID=MMETSP1066-20121228/291028_1 /TAXON_ID=671091 /ORGANISM="Coscinodiscus wailesii, Strain CCMP2513" /LENGTH=450 /DNA_ID=CAMNT_0013301257 /DNA_START=1047 /DNA_END=2398 /DNA_ORIENTATION=-